jgi:tRNA-dihydrouridine synthase
VAQEIVRQAKKGIADWSEGKVTIDDLNVSEEMKEWVMRHAGQSLSILASSSLGQKLRFQETKKLHHDSIPVSVKTRLGVDSIVVEDWMRALMEVEPAMITLHGRTLKQLYQGEANWEEIGKAAQVVHSLGGHILGNGDIQSLDDLHSKIVAYGVDGGLIGRASEGNPGIFTGTDNPTWDERKAWMLEHAKLFEKVFGPDRFIPMRKHLAWYCKDFPGASEMRGQLVRCSNVSQLYGILS